MISSAVRRKRKLKVIMGAGSSVSCGMPSVAEINELMKSWSAETFDPLAFPDGSLGSGVFADLWACIQEYYELNPRLHLGIAPNYEKVLGEMIALGSWVTPPPFGNSLAQAVVNAQ